MPKRILQLSDLVPYGWTNAENQEYLARRPVPLGFRVDPHSPGTASSDEWEEWLSARALRMSDFLWPIWTAKKGWSGKAAQDAVALTLADLDVIKSMRSTMTERIVDDTGKPTARHREAFREEDDGPPGKTLAYYTRAFPETLKPELTALIIAGGVEIARPASQGLKRLFMRPRPQQVGMQVNLPVTVERSASAITPSMISGHCIQGTLALASAEVGLKDWFEAFPAVLTEVRRFLLDTGDRRVLAGLHYPSDNIGSWYIALCMCTHIWGAEKGEEVRQALWSAIQNHSRVFAAVKRAACTKDGKAYVPLLKRLDAAATNGDL